MVNPNVAKGRRRHTGNLITTHFFYFSTDDFAHLTGDSNSDWPFQFVEKEPGMTSRFISDEELFTFITQYNCINLTDQIKLEPIVKK